MIVGVDTASDRWHAVSIRDGGEFFMKGEDKQKGSPDERRHALCRSFHDFLALLIDAGDGAAVHVFCEEPLALQNGKTTRLLGLVGGALWAQHLELDLMWHWTSNSAWNSWAGIKQSLKTAERKRLAREFAVLNLGPYQGHHQWDEDHFDAACIALHGRHQLYDAS